MTKRSLQVDRSFMGVKWSLPDADLTQVERFTQQRDVPEIIARLLVLRGVEEGQVDAFLNPTLKDHFPDPFSMAGMEAFADDVAQGIIDGRKFGIFGDFDVDGATSTAILVRFFRALGLDVPFYIPDRLKEGYGPNVKAFETLKAQGADYVLICDCGVTALDVINEGKELGLDIAVLDHHEPESTLPPANHVIDPKRTDDNAGLGMLAACGVVFLACVAINNKLRQKGYYKDHNLSEPPLKDWLDLVGLGTVCDMVPLTGANRLFVRYGFEQMAKRHNAGIKALLEVAKVQNDPDPYHAGFVMGPRINAGSRVHKSDLGATLLSTDDAQEALDLAWLLDDCNKKRQDIQAEMLTQAVNMVEDEALYKNAVILVGHEDWHPGLSGLVAGRLKEKYEKPAVAVTYTTNEKGKKEGRGSGRSIPGFNMGGVFHAAKDEGILIAGGGHQMAAGFTIAPERVDDLRDFLDKAFEAQMSGEALTAEMSIDALLTVQGASLELVKMLGGQFGPFGQDHPEPLFVFPNVRLYDVGTVGKDHVKLMLGDWEGSRRIKAIAFKAKDTPMGRAFLEKGYDQPFHVAGHLKINEWQGRESVEMHIKDADFALSGAVATQKSA